MLNPPGNNGAVNNPQLSGPPSYYVDVSTVMKEGQQVGFD